MSEHNACYSRESMQSIGLAIPAYTCTDDHNQLLQLSLLLFASHHRDDVKQTVTDDSHRSVTVKVCIASISWLHCKTISPLCSEGQVLPEANARVQNSLQKTLSCSVRHSVICLSLARLNPGISHLDNLKNSAYPWKQAVEPLFWH